MVAFGTDEEEWFLDSGATSNITGNQNLLLDFGPSHVLSIRTIGKQIMPIASKVNVTYLIPLEKDRLS